VTPYYNKPPQEGLYQHFANVAKAVEIPLILYNVPGRTGTNLFPETVLRLSEIPNIVAIKEASGSLPQAIAIAAMRKANFQLLSGEDALFLPLLSIGGQGIITVMGNAAPQPMVEAFTAFSQGDMQKAQAITWKLSALAEQLFIEPNPIPLKAVLAHLGFMRNELRLPLVPMSKTNEAKLLKTVDALEIRVEG